MTYARLALTPAALAPAPAAAAPVLTQSFTLLGMFTDAGGVSGEVETVGRVTSSSVSVGDASASADWVAGDNRASIFARASGSVGGPIAAASVLNLLASVRNDGTIPVDLSLTFTGSDTRAVNVRGNGNQARVTVTPLPGTLLAIGIDSDGMVNAFPGPFGQCGIASGLNSCVIRQDQLAVSVGRLAPGERYETTLSLNANALANRMADASASAIFQSVTLGFTGIEIVDRLTVGPGIEVVPGEGRRTTADPSEFTRLAQADFGAAGLCGTRAFYPFGLAAYTPSGPGAQLSFNSGDVFQERLAARDNTGCYGSVGYARALFDITPNVGEVVDLVGFEWSSIDDYNSITFYDGPGGSGEAIDIAGFGTTITGAEVKAAFGLANDAGGRAPDTFADFRFPIRAPLSMMFDSSAAPAFEFDNIAIGMRDPGTNPIIANAVPAPGALELLGVGAVALAARRPPRARRRCALRKPGACRRAPARPPGVQPLDRAREQRGRFGKARPRQQCRRLARQPAAIDRNPGGFAFWRRSRHGQGATPFGRDRSCNRGNATPMPMHASPSRSPRSRPRPPLPRQY